MQLKKLNRPRKLRQPTGCQFGIRWQTKGNGRPEREGPSATLLEKTLTV
jgi:hypothetical protein